MTYLHDFLCSPRRCKDQRTLFFWTPTERILGGLYIAFRAKGFADMANVLGGPCMFISKALFWRDSNSSSCKSSFVQAKKRTLTERFPYNALLFCHAIFP